MSLNYENPNIEQLLGIMERKVDTLMKDAILLMGRSESVFRMTTNEMYRPPSEPSRQEEFEHIEFLAHQNLDQAFFDSISTDPFSRPQWGNLFRVNEPIYRELVREFFASFEFEASACRYDPEHVGVKFRLGGEPREMSLLELGWRVGLYTERKSRDNATLSGLSRAETVKENRLLMEFWPSIGDSGFNVGNTKVASIRDPRVKLAHRCIATTIAGRKETIHRVTEIDLYYLYCIYTPEVICNISYWLSKYLKGVRDKNLIYGGMFVTRIARICVWPATRVVEEEEEAEEEAEGEAANEGVGGSAEMYQNMSQANWMYDHTVREFQYLSTQDNLEPHLQINPFPGREADYPPYGYHGLMPPGYAYRPGPSHDGSS
ncbi:hypothetical protein Tco_0757962 [Tanacetum coccineum]